MLLWSIIAAPDATGSDCRVTRGTEGAELRCCPPAMAQVPDCDEGAAQGRAWEGVWRWAEAAPALKSLTFDVCDTRPVPGGVMAGEGGCRP